MRGQKWQFYKHRINLHEIHHPEVYRALGCNAVQGTRVSILMCQCNKEDSKSKQRSLTYLFMSNQKQMIMWMTWWWIFSATGYLCIFASQRSNHHDDIVIWWCFLHYWLFVRNPTLSGGFSHHVPIMQSFEVFFVVSLNEFAVDLRHYVAHVTSL